MSMRLAPSAAVITVEALNIIERERWWDEGEDEDWLALMFDAKGNFLFLGQGATECQAAARAWVWTWHPCTYEPWDGMIPEFKPGDYRFELFAPGTWDDLTWDQILRIGRHDC
jgi:hypothetical protein